MKWISFGLSAIITVALFGTFASVGVGHTRASVESTLTTMYAVLPSGALVSMTAIE
jgi:hypothetical protein